MNVTMACWIYKSSKREQMYLYVDREDDFANVPAALLSAMGELQLVMTLELGADRKLARADVDKVMVDLAQRGFYLQMPPGSNSDHETI